LALLIVACALRRCEVESSTARKEIQRAWGGGSVSLMAKETNHRRPIIVGVAGGTASGKTTTSEAIMERVDGKRIAYIQHDSYYRDLSHLPLEERAKLNFDHPDALENELLISHLKQLLAWQEVDVPVYDFATYIRTGETRRVKPKRIIIVEGILVFVDKRLRELMDVKIYVDTDPDLRFIRRLQRDITERARSVESVIQQYLDTVRPMHLEFVEPSKRYADVIIPQGGLNRIAIDLIAARMEYLLHDDPA
jgi:uridine kinase